MKVFTGKVISKSMQKTATVTVRRVVAHPIYKKRIRMVKKYHVHDEVGVGIGQVVKFIATKPYSKLKKWKIIEVVGAEKSKKEVTTKTAKTVNKIKPIVEKVEKKKKAGKRSRRKRS